MVNDQEVKALRARVRKLTGALHKTIEDVWWMSAASDFNEGGKAHKGWIKVRDRTRRTELILEEE